jgi:S1-C subfamily serine protease
MKSDAYFPAHKRQPHTFKQKRKLVVLCILAVGVSSGLSQAQNSGVDWLKAIRTANWNAIVFVSVKLQRENGATETTTGTGFIVDPEGWVMTCNHLIPKKGDNDTLTINLTVGDRTETASYRNQAIRRDDGEDLALLKLPARDAGPWRIVKSIGDVETEAEIAAFGFPLTEGLVSKNGRITNKNGTDGKWITDAPVNPGMSGGPVFNQSGGVVAIVAGGYEEAQSLNLVIPVSSARVLLQRINSPLLVGSSVLPPPVKVEKPVVYSETINTAPGAEFQYSIEATGSPTKYNAFGLPPDLKLDREDGDISGTVVGESKSSYNVDIRAQNESGWGRGELVIRIKRTSGVEATPTPSAAQVTANLSRFVFQNGVFSVLNGNVYAPNGVFIGYLTGPNIMGAVATLAWTNGTASHFMADGSILNLYPGGTTVVGRWRSF